MTSLLFMMAFEYSRLCKLNHAFLVNMLISSTHPLTPEVTFDPKLPIRPVTFDLKPEAPTTSTSEFNY